jgi:AcrR family transcriptional regulator
MRADAQENHERLLEVAARAFAREGTGASLKAIAREAGVGIGTVYRRFPTRETLIEAVYQQEVARLCAAAPALAADPGGAAALRAWMEQFVDFMGTKRELLRPALTSDDEKQQTRDQLRSAIRVLLDAGVAAGTIRPSVDPNDLLLSLGGITLIADAENHRALAGRLIALLLDGVLT